MICVWLFSRNLSLSFFIINIYFSFSFLFFCLSFFFSCLFLLFLSFVSFCFLLFYFFFLKFFLYLSISSIHSEQMERYLFPSRTPEEAASMSAMRQLHGRPTPRSMSGASPELVDSMQYAVRVEQRTAMCQSMCSEPLSSTSATTRMFTVLLSGRFCLQKQTN